jgi:hypothetical protein
VIDSVSKAQYRTERVDVDRVKASERADTRLT